MSANLPKQWLEVAREDLVVARLVLKEGHMAHACFLSQQCIEKSLKAFLIARTNTHPRVHNLIDLLDDCRALDAQFASYYDDCFKIDRYYVPTRYLDAQPGTTPSGAPSKTEADEAITAAEHILQFVIQQLP